jgi:hypothetical protein
MDKRSLRQWLPMLACGGLLLTVSAVQAAKLVAPPTQQLLTEENQIAVVTVIGKVVSKNGDQRLHVKAEQMLHGEPFSEESVKLDAVSAADAKVGERYVLALSWFTKDPLTRGKGWVKNSAGPEAVGFTEVSSALLPTHPSLLALLALSNEPSDDAARIDNSLQLLADDNFKLRYLASMELLLNNRLAPAFSTSQRDQLRVVLAKPGYVAEHRDLMYRLALMLPVALRGDWLAELARKDLQTLGNQYDLASRVPSLAKTTTQVLRDHGNAGDSAQLTHLLRSNAPGVAKMALQALVKHDKAISEASLTAALADPSLPSESRRAFELYRKNGKLPG